MTVELKRRFRCKIGFCFDAMAAWLMCQHYKVDLNELDKIPKEEYTNSWVWFAHCSYCVLNYCKPMSYEWMKRFIANMRKSEWDKLVKAMNAIKAPVDDKKKVQPGENSLSQDGRQA